MGELRVPETCSQAARKALSKVGTSFLECSGRLAFPAELGVDQAYLSARGVLSEALFSPASSYSPELRGGTR